MKLSIIIPSYNSGSLLDLTLSNIEKKRGNTEVIVIDGGSYDHTNTVIDKYSSIVDLYISETDKGIYDAINKGVKLANGDYYVILGAGDFLHSHFLDYFENHFISNENFILFNVVSNGKLISANRGNIWRYGASGIMSHHSVGTFIRRDIHATIGYYSLKYSLLSDSDFILKAFKIGASFKFVPVVSGSYMGDGISSKNQMESAFELFLIQLRNGADFKIQLILLLLRLIKFNLSFYSND